MTNTPNSNDVPLGPLENHSKTKLSIPFIKQSTHVIRASHSNKFSSLTGPARIPSGGLFVNSKISIKFNLPKQKTRSSYVYIQQLIVLMLSLPSRKKNKNEKRTREKKSFIYPRKKKTIDSVFKISIAVLWRKCQDSDWAIELDDWLMKLFGYLAVEWSTRVRLENVRCSAIEREFRDQLDCTNVHWRDHRVEEDCFDIFSVI